MESTLVNYQSELQNEFAKIQSVVSPYVANSAVISNEFNSIQVIYDKKIKTLTPEIMFYGIYNAGKSSILNELLREDRAEVADKPTTHVVTYYDWNGYKISDTPGVGAPVDDELVTAKHLQLADVVIFVMSTTGSNEKKENYERMKAIVDSGKRVLIVLNDKNGDLNRNNENIEAVKNKVWNNVRQVGIVEQCSIVVVNALRAKNGRTRNKEALYNSSNFPFLEDVIKKELKSTNTSKVMANSVNEVIRCVERIISELSQTTAEEELSGLNKVLVDLKEQKSLMRKSVSEYVKSQTSRLANTLPNVIWANRENQEAINAAVNKEVISLNERVNKKISMETSEVLDSLCINLESYVQNLEKVQASLGKEIAAPKIDAIKCESAASLNSINWEQKIKDLNTIVENTKKLVDMYKKGTVVNAGKIASTLGNAFLAKEIAGAGIKFVAPVVTTAVGGSIGAGLSTFVASPYLAPIIALGTAIFSLFGDSESIEQKMARAEAQNRAAQARAEAETNARIELNKNCKYMAEDLELDIMNSVAEVLRSISSGLENVVKDEMAKSKAAAANNTAAIAELNDVIQNFEYLKQNMANV